jgi:hypothetical protein
MEEPAEANPTGVDGFAIFPSDFRREPGEREIPLHFCHPCLARVSLRQHE